MAALIPKDPKTAPFVTGAVQSHIQAQTPARVAAPTRDRNISLDLLLLKHVAALHIQALLMLGPIVRSLWKVIGQISSQILRQQNNRTTLLLIVQ